MKQSKADAHYAARLMQMREYAAVKVVAALPGDGLFCLIFIDGEWRPVTIPPPNAEQKRA